MLGDVRGVGEDGPSDETKDGEIVVIKELFVAALMAEKVLEF